MRKPRSQSAIRALQDALIELSTEMEYDKITVQDIVDKADLARSTFYVNCKDKDDLLKSAVKRLWQEMLESIIVENKKEREKPFPSLAVFRYLEQHLELYKALMSARDVGATIYPVRQLLEAHARDYLMNLEKQGIQLLIPAEIIANYLACTMLSQITWWLDNDMPFTVEQMNEMSMQLMMKGVEAAMQWGFDQT